MQTQDFSNLLAGSLQDYVKEIKGLKPKANADVLKEMTVIEQSNKQHLKESVLPDDTRIPTAEELVQMRNFAIEYKRCNKQASKREIRRATQKQFNIRIYK